MEQLSGHALERRAGQDGGRRQQGPHRRRSRRRPRECSAAGRRGDVHAVGRCLCAQARPSSRPSTATRFRPEFTPGVQCLARHQAAQDQGRSPDAIRHAAIPAGGQSRGRPARCRPPTCSQRDGAPRHPAELQLRPRRRPLRGRAVLRRDEHEAHRREVCERRCSWSAPSSSSGTVIWIATFPVNVAV